MEPEKTFRRDRMKANTKAKLQIVGRKIWNGIKTYAPWIAGGVLVGGALRGYTNERDINRLYGIDNEMAKTVIQNNEKLEALERQQNLLFERALRETEGKTE